MTCPVHPCAACCFSMLHAGTCVPVSMMSVQPHGLCCCLDRQVSGLSVSKVIISLSAHGVCSRFWLAATQQAPSFTMCNFAHTGVKADMSKHCEQSRFMQTICNHMRPSLDQQRAGQQVSVQQASRLQELLQSTVRAVRVCIQHALVACLHRDSSQTAQTWLQLRLPQPGP